MVPTNHPAPRDVPPAWQRQLLLAASRPSAVPAWVSERSSWSKRGHGTVAKTVKSQLLTVSCGQDLCRHSVGREVRGCAGRGRLRARVRGFEGRRMVPGTKLPLWFEFKHSTPVRAALGVAMGGFLLRLLLDTKRSVWIQVPLIRCPVRPAPLLAAGHSLAH